MIRHVSILRIWSVRKQRDNAAMLEADIFLVLCNLALRYKDAIATSLYTASFVVGSGWDER